MNERAVGYCRIHDWLYRREVSRVSAMYYIIVISQLILVVQQIFEEHKTSENEFFTKMNGLLYA